VLGARCSVFLLGAWNDPRADYLVWHAMGEGGVWVENFNVNGRSGDPSALPFPEDFRKVMGPGRGGVRTDHNIPSDPRCVARAQAEPQKIYRHSRG
jgi:hypothetical protein